MANPEDSYILKIYSSAFLYCVVVLSTSLVQVQYRIHLLMDAKNGRLFTKRFLCIGPPNVAIRPGLLESPRYL